MIRAYAAVGKYMASLKALEKAGELCGAPMEPLLLVSVSLADGFWPDPAMKERAAILQHILRPTPPADALAFESAQVKVFFYY